MNGNFCTVEMMIFFPSVDELPQVARVFRVPHRRADLRELLDGLLNLLVEQRRSVMTMIESKTASRPSSADS